MRGEEPTIRFWRRVNKNGANILDTQCWEWTGGKTGIGYGNFFFKKDMGAHRYSWELHFGEIPKGLKVLHRCDNIVCVRPEHMDLGTHDDNMRDMAQKGRHRRGRRLTNVKEIKERLARGESYIAISKEIGCTPMAIYRIKVGTVYKNVI